MVFAILAQIEKGYDQKVLNVPNAKVAPVNTFFLKPDLTFQRIFAKLKLSLDVFKKIPSFVRLVFKMEINELQSCKFCFLEKQADLKTNCTRL